jgi:hypothetical protein
VNKNKNGLVIFIGILIGFSTATLIRSKIFDCSLIAGTCCFMGFYDSLAGRLPARVPFYSKIDNKENKGEKNFLFVGVMSAQSLLDTRAKASYETWVQNLPGKLAYFSSAGSTSKYSLPIVSLDGVDDSYPPQKKSFMMLKYMHDHYIDEFEWFMRVDDDLYIRPEKIEKLLRSINSSEAQFIGQAGLGNTDEFGLLSLEEDENFCMGGPGIAMSRETLKRVVPHIHTCIKNLYTTHEDVEIGRCIRQFANVSCTWAYDVRIILLKLKKKICNYHLNLR